MKKSPLNRMRGNGATDGNRNYQYSPYNSPLQRNNNWNHNNDRRENYSQGGYYQSNSGSDFIPFQTSSPIPHNSYRNNSNNWQGSRGGYSGGYNKHRNNFFNSPGSNQGSPFTPFRPSGRQNNGKQNFQKGSQRKVDIRSYLDFKSIFEDPWSELEDQLNNAKSENENKKFEDDSLEVSKVESSSVSPDSVSDCLTNRTTDVSDLSLEIQQTPEVS